MAAAGEITPMPSAAIFADTQAEPKSVYQWLDWLETQLPFPVYRVSQGNLAADVLTLLKRRKKGTDDTWWPRSAIPGLPGQPGWHQGSAYAPAMHPRLQGRPDRAQSRELLLGIWRHKCHPVDRHLLRRSASHETLGECLYSEHRYPLIERKITRGGLSHLDGRQQPPAPASQRVCLLPVSLQQGMAPIEEEEPLEFPQAVEFERKFDHAKNGPSASKRQRFLHTTASPWIRSTSPRTPRQMDLWGNECEGLCGV